MWVGIFALRVRNIRTFTDNPALQIMRVIILLSTTAITDIFVRVCIILPTDVISLFSFCFLLIGVQIIYVVVVSFSTCNLTFLSYRVHLFIRLCEVGFSVTLRHDVFLTFDVLVLIITEHVLLLFLLLHFSVIVVKVVYFLSGVVI